MQASLRSLRKLGCALPVSKDGRPRSGLVVETRRCATLLTMRGQTQVPTPDQRIPPVPDLGLPSPSTGAKP